MPLLLDAEMISQDISDFPEHLKQFIYKNEDDPKLNLSPYTGQVAAIACYDPFAQAPLSKGVCFVASTKMDSSKVELPNDEWKVVKCKDEASMLTKFWKRVRTQEIIVSFAGTSFDIPFMAARSAILGIPAAMNFVNANKYYDEHVDWQVKLSSFGNFKAPLNFSLLCHVLGVADPKSVMDGSMVDETWRNGDHHNVASYVIRDVVALTAVSEILAPVYCPSLFKH